MAGLRYLSSSGNVARLFQEVRYCRAFAVQFSSGRIHFFTAEGIYFQPLDNFVVAVFAAAGVRIDDARGNTVGTIGRNRHADPVIALCA